MPMLWLMLACAEPPATPAPAGGPEVTGGAQDQPLTDPDRQAGRSRKRMNIDQLDASLRALTGEGWTEIGEDGEEVDLFERLGGSLGKPDYLDATEEDLVPGLLFQKFLGDAATSACRRLVARESGGGERRLRVGASLEDAPDSAAARADVARALLLFHGRAVNPADDVALGPWLRLMTSAGEATGDPESAWRALCVGLITHPDFSSY